MDGLQDDAKQVDEGGEKVVATDEGVAQARVEMDELRRRGDKERVGFELRIARARNVEAAALLSNCDNDIEKLKAVEPWLFGAVAAALAQAGATGLPNAGAVADEGAQMRCRRASAGIDDEEE